MRLVLSFALVALVAGCSRRECVGDECDRYRPTYNVIPAQKPSAPRFIINRIDVVEDGLAYGNRRGVYVITDTKTGREFVGVSGIGISELGSHTQQSGKTTTTVGDER